MINYFELPIIESFFSSHIFWHNCTFPFLSAFHFCFSLYQRRLSFFVSRSVVFPIYPSISLLIQLPNWIDQHIGPTCIQSEYKTKAYQCEGGCLTTENELSTYLNKEKKSKFFFFLICYSTATHFKLIDILCIIQNM